MLKRFCDTCGEQITEYFDLPLPSKGEGPAVLCRLHIRDRESIDRTPDICGGCLLKAVMKVLQEVPTEEEIRAGCVGGDWPQGRSGGVPGDVPGASGDSRAAAPRLPGDASMPEEPSITRRVKPEIEAARAKTFEAEADLCYGDHCSYLYALAHSQEEAWAALAQALANVVHELHRRGWNHEALDDGMWQIDTRIESDGDYYRDAHLEFWAGGTYGLQQVARVNDEGRLKWFGWQAEFRLETPHGTFQLAGYDDEPDDAWLAALQAVADMALVCAEGKKITDEMTVVDRRSLSLKGVY